MTALHMADISTHGEWVTLDLGRELEAGYRAVTGWNGEQAPIGLSLLAGRLALTRGGRPLPPGGVLLGIDLASFVPPPREGRFEFTTSTDVRPHRNGSSLVRAVTRLRLPAGRDVAHVTFTIRWPGE